MKFNVLVREVHVQIVLVEATDAVEAMRKVRHGEGEYDAIEYSHTLDPETWTVEEVGEPGR